MLDKYMELVIREAKKCTLDIPVAAAIVKDNEIISIEKNKKEENNSATSHAEILAINKANEKLNSWRLDNCDMYVTLEPCPMCMWAIISARIKNLYFGSFDTQYGAISASNLKELSKSKINILGGIMEEECNKLLDDYFEKLRNEKNFR